MSKQDSAKSDKGKAPAKAPRGRRRRYTFVLGLLGAIGIAVAGVALQFRPVSEAHHTVNLRVPGGANVARIGNLLQEKGVIRSAWAFDWYVRWRGEGSRIKAGRYALSPDMTLAQILQELKAGGRGTGDRLRVSIPEGFTLKQIAAALDAKGIAASAAFLKLATSEDAIAQMHADFPLPKSTLEGYLFPDTYEFPPHTPPQQVIDDMLTNFGKRFARPYQAEIARSGRDLHRLVTEASLIEREAKVPQDRPRIAGVLDNRLQRGMRLEVDATVLYALGHHKDRVLYEDLKVDSPYNTYRHKGLPPGPIANPGLPCLLAALRPESNDYLYYVARPDGSHIFTRTPSEHEAAKRQAHAERRQRERATEEQSGG